MKEALAALKDYQLLLNRIGELEKLLSFVPDDVQELENEWSGMEDRLSELKQRREEQTELLKTQELALVEASERAKKFEHDLNEVTNSKEYNAVIKEIDSIRKKIASFNDSISTLMVEQEDVAKNIDECSILAKESKKKFDDALAEFRGSQHEHQQELDEKSAQRDAMAKHVPERLMRSFERIASRRNGIGLALCVDNMCTACNVLVRQNVVDRLRLFDRVIQCDSCQRILYFQEEEALTG